MARDASALIFLTFQHRKKKVDRHNACWGVGMASHVSESDRDQQPDQTGDGASSGVAHGEAPRHLFERIGAFLDTHRLGADPATYNLVYRVLNEPQGSPARAVNGLVDGGVRLTLSDIASLGESAGEARAPSAAGETWVARAQTQLEDVEHLVRTDQAEAKAFATQERKSGGLGQRVYVRVIH